MTNTTIAAKLAAAVHVWWKGHRPVAWTEAQHAENPTVNCTTDSEIKLAKALRAYDTAKGAEPPSPAGEPVAWAVTYLNDVSNVFLQKRSAEQWIVTAEERYGKSGNRKIVPLYEQPPHAAPEAQEG